MVRDNSRITIKLQTTIKKLNSFVQKEDTPSGDFNIIHAHYIIPNLNEDVANLFFIFMKISRKILKNLLLDSLTSKDLKVTY